ncbi:universal stress protein [Ligilactobacillus hayakitensis DSM 18933 = JCM 14209]|uniref:Universal stress protein n=1 Tax=Ligilactobacillus hayakitensis DSM 18933 = JCM 14209 TaxID=1423755 RepID=A0A0R1WPB4_9LACO|nr:universal stress protein [Ligilactobacillus hayakitensis]KRM19738.1 universal stress protein [Ligilactobacillus hayakitensis DSM 18933 = JCM 14209]
MDTEKVKNIKRILVGVDDSEDAQLAFRVAMRRAIELDATLIITSILESNEMNVYQALSRDYVHGERSDLEKHIQEYKKVALEAGVKKVETVISEGNAGEQIVKTVIPQTQPDLLIIGALSKAGIKKYFGSQAAYIVKNSPVSVLVVR